MADKDKAKQLFKKGMAEFLDQNYGDSIETLSSAIELDPNHKLALLSRGDRLHENGQSPRCQGGFWQSHPN